MEDANGAVVAFLDDDAEAEPDWLASFAEGYQGDRRPWGRGRRVPEWGLDRPCWYPAEFDWKVGCSYLGLPRTLRSSEPVRMEHVLPARSRRGCGGFRLGYGCDETELCIRLSVLRPNSRLLYLPDASVRHRVPGTRGTLKHFVTRCYFEGA